MWGQLLEDDLGHGTEYISAIFKIVCALHVFTCTCECAMDVPWLMCAAQRITLGFGLHFIPC